MRTGNVSNMVVQDTYTGGYFVATRDVDWERRLASWKHFYLLDPKTNVPAPMPIGHIMFKNAGSAISRYVIISFEAQEG